MAELLLVGMLWWMTAGGLDPNRLGQQEIAVVSTLVHAEKHQKTYL